MPVLNLRCTKLKAKRNPKEMYKGGPITFIPMPRFDEVSEDGEHLMIRFRNTLRYKPNLGFFRIEGCLTFGCEEAQKKEILKLWKKNKRFPEDVYEEIMSVMSKYAYLAFGNLAFELGLPLPYRTPDVKLLRYGYG